VKVRGKTVTIRGSIDSTTNGSFEIELFANGSCDRLGYGEGEYPIGGGTVFTDGTGAGTFSFTLPHTVRDARVFTATATDAAGNTSEFSRCLAG